MSSWLRGYGPLYELVAGRVYHDQAPADAAPPYVVFFGVSNQHGHALDAADGLPTARVQVECYAATSLGAHAVSDAVRERLDGFNGEMSGLRVPCVMLDDARDDLDPPQDGSSRGVHRVSLDFFLSYAESVPSF